MGKQNDSLVEVENPDRVHYATGVLLNAEDFLAEQNYHRGRLARALRYANGWGTLAGLEIEFEAALPATETSDGKEERIIIKPGIAIDRMGRLIEVVNPLCLRTRVWYDQQAGDELDNSWHAAGLWAGAPDGVAVDVFIRFAVCERGKTPAFAAGPFDTIDAVTAARLRDGYETELVLRKEEKPVDPQSHWPTVTGSTQAERTTQLREAIYLAWQESTKEKGLDGLEALAEHPIGLDTTSLFLARMIIPADKVGAGQAPTRRPNDPVVINNDLRPFVITANALALILGIKISTSSST